MFRSNQYSLSDLESITLVFFKISYFSLSAAGILIAAQVVDIVVNNKNGSLSFFYDNCDNVLISHSFERLFPLKSISLERLGMPIIV